jgi:hypothetical protein
MLLSLGRCVCVSPLTPRGRGVSVRRQNPGNERLEVASIAGVVRGSSVCRKLCRHPTVSRSILTVPTRLRNLATRWWKRVSPVSSRRGRRRDRIKSPLLYQLSYRDDVLLTAC